MAPRITGPMKAQFFRLRREGFSIKDAAEAAGFSESSGKGLWKHGKADNSFPGSRPERFRDDDEQGFGPPVAYEDLSDVARDCWDDFGRFRFRYFGWKSAPWQEIAANKLVELLATEDEEYLVINCPPGAGKTELFSHHIPAWLTVRDRSLRGLLGSHGKVVSEGLTGNLRDSLGRRFPVQARAYDLKRGRAWDAQAALGDDYGGFRPQAGDIWRRNQFTVAQYGETPTAAKESTWSAFSPQAGFLGWRVNFCSWDDLVTPKMLNNQEKVEELYGWYDDVAETRLEPGGLFVLVGQRLRSNDIYRYALDKKLWTDEMEDEGDPDQSVQKYHHIIFKAHYEEQCEGKHKPSDPSYPEGCLLDSVRIGMRRIRAAQDAGNFETVFQQKDSDPTKVLVRREWINGGKDIDGVEYEGSWDADRTIGQLPKHIPPGAFTVRYMTVDPSPTKFWSIQDWFYVLPSDGTEPLAGYRYLIDLDRRKMPVNEFLDWSQDQQAYLGVAEDWVQRSKEQGHPITYLIMERNAAQRWAMQYEFVRNWARTRGVAILEHETTKNKSDPEYGIWATLPAQWRYGRVRLPGDNLTRSPVQMQPLVNEVTQYPDGVTDDCVMSQWFGEYHLQNLVANRQKVGTLYPDLPSWVRGSPRADAPTRLTELLTAAYADPGS